MAALYWLVPIALTMGAVGLIAFLWALRAGQFDDLEGAAHRILDERPPGAPNSDTPDDKRTI